MLSEHNGIVGYVEKHPELRERLYGPEVLGGFKNIQNDLGCLFSSAKRARKERDETVSRLEDEVVSLRQMVEKSNMANLLVPTGQTSTDPNVKPEKVRNSSNTGEMTE